MPHYKPHKPCVDCPFRKNSLAGYLGVQNPMDFLIGAHGETPMICHNTYKLPVEKQAICTGSVLHAAMNGKRYRNPDLAKLQDAMGQPDPSEILNIQEFLDRKQEVLDLCKDKLKNKL